MNALTNLFFIFIFMLTILYNKIIDIGDMNYILHKIILFALLFICQFTILVISKIKNGCVLNYETIGCQSIETATIGIIGYSIYNDLQHSNVSGMSEISDEKIKYVYIAIIITLLLTFVNSIKLMIGYIPYECIKYKEQNKSKK